MKLELNFYKADTQEEFNAMMDSMNNAMREWTRHAARGECGWVCADCSCSFPNGMPDKCKHGHESCTNIIQRDKREAMREGNEAF